MTHQQRPSHAVLTNRFSGTATRDVVPLDALIVPASRPAESLVPAIELAARSGVRLVVLASHSCDVDEVGRQVADTSGCSALVASIDPGYSHDLFDFQTSDPAFFAVQAGRRSNLSLKRNLGLVLALLMGWKKIMFLDDDVTLGPRDLHRMAHALNRHQVAGYQLLDFPDNSVVCHANRLSGATQDVFVSGAALGVNIGEKPMDFFPDVYNEDWFFMAAHAKLGDVASLGELRQAPFNPFEDPHRAEVEEFGDLLVEGLYARYQDTYLADYDDGFVLDRLTADYWKGFKDARRDLITGVRSRLDDARDNEHKQARESLRRAERQLETIGPEECADFIRRWRADRGAFARRAAHLHAVWNPVAAFGHLGVPFFEAKSGCPRVFTGGPTKLSSSKKVGRGRRTAQPLARS